MVVGDEKRERPPLKQSKEGAPNAKIPNIKASDGGVRGMPNYGNTCYQNALLQCLLAVPSGLLHADHRDDFLVGLLSSQAGTNGGGGSARVFYDAFTRPLFGHDGTQQDAHELFRALLGHCLRLAEEEKFVSWFEAGAKGQRRFRIRCGACHSLVETPVADFYDVSLSLESPECIPLGSISLEDEKEEETGWKGSGISVEGLLKNSLKQDLPVLDFFHEKCPRRGDPGVATTSRCEVLRWPRDLLVLHIQRFRKIQKRKRTLIEKDLTPVYPSPSIQQAGGDCRWELRGIVVHEGRSVDSGHYTAIVKRPCRDDRGGDGWYYCSDEHVRMISSACNCKGDPDKGHPSECRCLDSEALARQAYLLFYTKANESK